MYQRQSSTAYDNKSTFTFTGWFDVAGDFVKTFQKTRVDTALQMLGILKERMVHGQYICLRFFANRIYLKFAYQYITKSNNDESCQ
jgi:hypothetical protein